MKILIVDDNLTNLMVMKALVNRIELCESYTYDLPSEALRWCENNHPDLVLLDYMMPDIDGITFLRRFRTLPGNGKVPVIMVSAYNEADIRNQALEAGASDYIHKPIDKVEFLARVNNTLSLHQSLANRIGSNTLSDGNMIHDPYVCQLNIEYLMDLFGEDEPLIGELLEVFETSTGNLLSKLGDAVKQKDAMAVKAFAHQIKGACSNIGVTEMAELAASIERATIETDWDNINAVLTTFRARFNDICGEIAIYQNRDQPK